MDVVGWPHKLLRAEAYYRVMINASRHVWTYIDCKSLMVGRKQSNKKGHTSVAGCVHYFFQNSYIKRHTFERVRVRIPSHCHHMLDWEEAYYMSCLIKSMDRLPDVSITGVSITGQKCTVIYIKNVLNTGQKCPVIDIWRICINYWTFMSGNWYINVSITRQKCQVIDTKV